MLLYEPIVGEEWRDIAGFEGYQISSHGRVRSFRSRKSGQCGSLMKVDPPSSFQPTVGLKQGGKTICFFVSRLVLEAFVGPSPNKVIVKDCIKHLDGDNYNNHVSNLEWMPLKTNAVKKVENLRRQRLSHPSIITLTPEQELQEVWKRYTDADFLEVSNFGRIKKETRYAGGQLVWELAATNLSTNGYRMFQFRLSGVKHRRFVHRMVLETFVGRRLKGQQCRHLDGDPLNNKLDNICWGTPVENAADRYRHGTAHFGETHHMATLSDAAVANIREQFASGKKTQKQLAEQHSCSIAHISNILLGKRRSCEKLAAAAQSSN